MFAVSRTSDKPMVEQLREQLAASIVSGELPEGQRLPSTRQLAQRLEVNRATVVEAYRRLEQDGLIEQRRGSGSYACGPAARQARPARAGRPAGWRSLASERPTPEPRPALPEGALDLASLSPADRHHPVDAFADCFARVMERRGASALSYGPSLGDARLREVLAERLRRRGLDVSPGSILVVGGAQQGLDLIFRATLGPGDVVLTEAPTYHLALDLLRFHGARVVGLPLLPAAPGMSTLDFAALERQLDARAGAPSLAYVMPTFQNPTGLTLDPAARRRLATACRDAGVLIVEDDYEADMAGEAARLAPIAALPESGEAAYVGTLSKALYPGLRVGWVVAGPELLARLAQVKRLSDLSGALLLQAVAAELIESGAYDAHLADAVASTGRRMSALVRALAKALPEGCRVSAPKGGHVLWLETPVASGAALAEAALREGVAISAGEAFQPTPGATACARLSVARLEESRVDEAASRLARAVAACIAQGRQRPALGADMERPVQV